MTQADQTRINESWPSAQLESVHTCPYCQSTSCSLAFEGVKDWTFYSASGHWSFWDCNNCGALFLNPRPTESSISEAYKSYYTHDKSPLNKKKSFKERLINECFSHWLGVNISPRIHVPKLLAGALKPLKKRLVEGFGLTALATGPKGRLMDVGCGSGEQLHLARMLGWDVEGIEMDPQAVRAARSRGLKVKEGTYEALLDMKGQFDGMICSHVLEHVYRPLELLDLINQALRPGGLLIISAPNAKSKARAYFGVNWRGLEAPRHLAIPSASFLRTHLAGMGYDVSQRMIKTFPSILESLRIQGRKLTTNQSDKQQMMQIRNVLGEPNADTVDFIELVCRKNA